MPVDLQFLFQVGTSYQQPVATARVRSTAPPKTQTKYTSYTGRSVISKLDRCSFVKWCLSLHGLDEQYTPGERNGPLFTIHWTGSAYVLFVKYMLLWIDMSFIVAERAVD